MLHCVLIKGVVPTIGLGNILVLRYYRNKYIHDNITTSLLAYRDNRANDNTATSVDTACTKPLSAMQRSRYNFKLQAYSVVPLASCALLPSVDYGLLRNKLHNIPGYKP